MQVIGLLSSIFGIVATIFIGREVKKIWQAYQRNRDASQIPETNKETEGETRKAQSDSDRLKEIEGR